MPGAALPARPRPLLRFHQVRENIVDSRQVAFALGPQPIEYLSVKAYTDCYLARPGVAQPHHIRQLLIGKTRNVFEVDARVVPHRLAPGNTAQGLALPFSPLPVPDIFGSHAFQPRGLR